MPHLHLSLCPAPGQQPDLEALARMLTGLAARLLDKDASLTAVRFTQHAPTHWFVAGRSLVEAGRASYQLELQVTAGTNRADQIEAYLDAVHQALAAALGPLLPTSYAVVQQLPAEAWGYGGSSQAARRAARQPGAAVPA